jgi:hypothetical protein
MRGDNTVLLSLYPSDLTYTEYVIKNYVFFRKENSSLYR